MRITESRLRKIIRHVLSETERSKRRSGGMYKTKAPTGLAAFTSSVHDTKGSKESWDSDDGYDSIMGFDEADEPEKEEEEIEESDPAKPSGCGS